MGMRFKSMPDCCWRYLDGINYSTLNKKDFQTACLQAFKDPCFQMSNWHIAEKLPGAVLFCGAYSGGAMTIYGDTVNKTIVTQNVEKICTWVEDEELGYIVELPEFRNGLHKSKILARMWVIDETMFKKAMKRWYKEPTVKKTVHDEARNIW